MSAAPGANICCYNSHPQNDASYQSISVACTHENLHQNSLCAAVVNLTTDTLRANSITVNELQASQIITGDPVTAGSFTAGATNITRTGPGIFIFSSISFSPEVANNIVLNGTGNGIIVGEDGWYRISLELLGVLESLSLTPTTSIGIGVNGMTSSFVGLDSPFGGLGQTVSGNTLVLLSAGDLINVFVSINDSPSVNLMISATGVRLEALRLGP